MNLLMLPGIFIMQAAAPTAPAQATARKAFLGLPIMLLVALGLTALLVILLRRRKPKAQDAATCGQCGYVVRGIASMNCPECGADLREVGIVPPGTGRSRSPGVAGAIAIVLPLVLLLLLILVVIIA